MVEIRYDYGRIAVVVGESALREAKGGGQFFVAVTRRCTREFMGAHAVAWCDTLETAQHMARMLVGVELTRDFAAVWPDGRTGRSPEPPKPPAAEERFRRWALEQWGGGGEIEIDDHAFVSMGEDGGAYVAAWVWVTDEGD